MRPPLRDQRTPYGCTAHHAGLARPLINAVLELEKAAPAVGIHVIRNRGAALRDRLRQNLHDGGMQPLHALRTQSRADGQRMNTRPEQRFVGIDVAHAAHEVLIQQHRLDARFSALQPRGELRQA